MHLKVENEPDLVRDTKSNAILNTNETALQAYKKRKRAVKENADRLNSLESKVINIETMLHEILERLPK